MVTVAEALEEVLRSPCTGRGRRPIVPGAQVLEWYENGQPAAYLVQGERLTRRQYHRLVKRLQEAGTLPARKAR